MKFLKFFILISALFLFSTHVVCAKNLPEIYNSQIEMSGVKKIESHIPKHCKKILEDIGVNGVNEKEIFNLSPQKLFESILNLIKKEISLPLNSFCKVISIMILCVIVESIYPPFKNQEMSKILNGIASLCVCICVINPLINTINSSLVVIKSASNFILCYAPIMMTIMTASGQAISATSYHTASIFAGQFISKISEMFLIPLLSTILGISVVSSISSNLKLDFICNNAQKLIKSILKIFSSIFAGLVAIQNLVTNSADNLNSGIAKCVLSECVPIIGSMVSDAYTAVQGCTKLLKSSFGAFGIIAGFFIFLPIFLQCGLFIVFLNLSKCMGDILNFKKISSLFNSAASVMSTVLAILIFSAVILIISSATVLVIGGK